MDGLLTGHARAALLLGVIAASPPAAGQLEPGSGRHAWSITAAVGVPDSETPLAAWPDGGHGKLRHAEAGLALDRVAAEYRGRITPTLDVHVVADYVDDVSSGLDLTEAWLEWRPVPERMLRQRWRFGAFYPRMSLENVGPAWTSPLTASFSAVNTWLGEEIRTFGAEWLGHRKLGRASSAHELGVYAGGFVGNDPAGTLLFWRGWSVHDRQSRFGDRLPLPARPMFGAGALVGLTPQTLDPFAEIDGEPGVYAGVEWRVRRRALLRVSHYDNRADPLDFADGQWSWDTVFDHVGLQLELPFGLGLVAQRLAGRTRWLVPPGADGVVSLGSRVERDEFAARFVLLTKRLGDRHRVTLRRDDFSFDRSSSAEPLEIEAGDAWTASYRFELSERVTLTAEWLEIRSRRALRPLFYSLPEQAEERQLRLRFDVRAGGSTRP